MGIAKLGHHEGEDGFGPQDDPGRTRVGPNVEDETKALERKRASLRSQTEVKIVYVLVEESEGTKEPFGHFDSEEEAIAFIPTIKLYDSARRIFSIEKQYILEEL